MRIEQLLCIRCCDMGGELFKLAHSLAGDLLRISGDSLHEVDRWDAELKDALSVRGGVWVEDHFLVVTTKSGPLAGLRAVGLGSNLKKRRRAANLALAATA